MDNNTLSLIKKILREDEIPFFTDEEIEAYYQNNGSDMNKTVYSLCLTKAENTTVEISGLTMGDTSEYFLRLAQRYRPHNSGTLKGF